MKADELWKMFIEKYPDYKEETYEAWSYGAAQDKLADLTLKGIKTATTSGYALYEAEGEPVPKEGDFSIILGGQDLAVCIIRTTKIYVKPFSEASERHAYMEGEGDRTLAYWRDVHIEFFEHFYQEAGIPFNEEALMVYEEFEKVFPDGGTE